MTALPAWLQAAQLLLLRVLHACGLTGDIAGQPAWPFAQRIAVETLAIDAGLARQFVWACGAVAAIAPLLACAAASRRLRWPACGIALVVAAAVPWPAPALLLTDAVPTSFHHSTTSFDAPSIDAGLALYRTHCAACHGADGRGETPLAATLATWPPRLTGGLLWKRAEGELHWRIRHGITGRDGTTTMPTFAHTLGDADTWAVLDGLRALAAGDSVRRESAWQWPVRVPDLQVRCDLRATRALEDWRGQRLRIVVARGDDAPPREDPRLVTIVLRAANAAPSTPTGCIADARGAMRAFATVAGVALDALPGTQFIVDRDGWLRAIAPPGDSAWSSERLLCRAGDVPRDAQAAKDDGLDGLIRQMDADPVRLAAFGLPHAR